MVELESKTSDDDHLEFGKEKPSSDTIETHADPDDQKVAFPEGGIKGWSIVLGV